MGENLNSNDQKGSVSSLYIPGGSEKKKTILMYLLFGIIMFSNKKEMTRFEYFHFRQSIGWFILFVLMFVLSLIFMFLPVIKYIGFLIILSVFVFWFMFILQAWNGKYEIVNGKMGFLSLFVGVGDWVINLFEMDIKISGDEDEKNISSLKELLN